MTDADRVTELAESARRIFTQILKVSIGTEKTAGSCAYATFMTKLMFDRFTAYQSILRGGDGGDDGGYIDAKGDTHGHYWLEVHTPEGPYIVDLTADQFGNAPVIVLPVAGNIQYIVGNQQLVDEHFHDVRRSIPHF